MVPVFLCPKEGLYRLILLKNYRLIQNEGGTLPPFR